MKKKTTDIKLIIGLMVIFFSMFILCYISINTDAPNILLKSSEKIQCIDENTANTKVNSTSNVTSNKTQNQTSTEKNNAATNQNAKNTNSNSNTSKTTTKAKSTNADLSNLGIKPNDFSGFSPNKTTYDVTVPADVTEVEVYATAKDSKAKISGTGKKKLEDGKNALAVVVTAESGATKTYTINVTKEGSEEQENTEEVTQRGLSNFKINNLEISPKFETNVYEYTAKYIGEGTKLDITATPTDPKYVVEIMGNEELKEGENIITILVSDNEGENVATYQITLTKSLVDEEAIAREQEEARKKEEQKKMLIIGGVVAVVIIAIIIYLIIRNRRNSAWEEDYMMPYTGNENDGFIDDESEEDYNNQDDYQDNYYEDEPTLSKKEAREQFLNGYNKDVADYFEEERPRRHNKGKRFK